MRILLTGASGDLGRMLSPALMERGDEPIGIDIIEPRVRHGAFLFGSILDREFLRRAMAGIDCVVHIAAWHGIHLFKGEKNATDFWDLNVTGTFNVFQAAADTGVKKVLFISSESASDRHGIYGHTKVMGEEIALTYAKRHAMNVVTLRPRAFIPYWNGGAYGSWIEWARWFWKGAVHISDVKQAVIRAITLLESRNVDPVPVLNVDGAYEYTAMDLASWDSGGKGTTFRKYYDKHYDLALRHGLDPSLKPEVLDIGETRALLGYEPEYSARNLLGDLERWGPKGPPHAD